MPLTVHPWLATRANPDVFARNAWFGPIGSAHVALTVALFRKSLVAGPQSIFGSVGNSTCVGALELTAVLHADPSSRFFEYVYAPRTVTPPPTLPRTSVSSALYEPTPCETIDVDFDCPGFRS